MSRSILPFITLLCTNVLFLFLIGCKNNSEPKPAPIITVRLDSAEAHEGARYQRNDKVLFFIHTTTGEPISKIYASRSLGASVKAIHDTLFPKDSGFDPPTLFNTKYAYTIDTSITSIFYFTVEDAKGNTATATYTINPALTEILDQKIYNAQGTNKPAYDFLNMTATDSSDANAAIISADSVGNASSFAAKLRLKNGTTLVKSYSLTDYTYATHNSIRVAIAAGSRLAYSQRLSAGDVYAVKTIQNTDTTYAIFKITSIYDDGAAGNNDYIQFSVKAAH